MIMGAVELGTIFATSEKADFKVTVFADALAESLHESGYISHSKSGFAFQGKRDGKVIVSKSDELGVNGVTILLLQT